MAEKNVIMMMKKAGGEHDVIYPKTRAADGTTFDGHLADYVRHPGYAKTTGEASAYLATLSPAPPVLAEGLCVAVKIHIENAGPSTINVNGKGAKPIKTAGGEDVIGGELKAGSIYTLRYNGANFILQGEGGDKAEHQVASGRKQTEGTGLLVVTGLGFDPNYITYVHDETAMGVYGGGVEAVITSGKTQPANWAIVSGGFSVDTMLGQASVEWVAIKTGVDK